jgi:hypothetical protein
LFDFEEESHVIDRLKKIEKEILPKDKSPKPVIGLLDKKYLDLGVNFFYLIRGSVKIKIIMAKKINNSSNPPQPNQ